MTKAQAVQEAGQETKLNNVIVKLHRISTTLTEHLYCQDYRKLCK